MRILTIIFTLLCLPAMSQIGTWEAQGPNARVMRHQDGSRTVYRRTPGDKILVKKNVGINGKVRLVTKYFMDNYGNPRSCKIYDSSDTLIYKVAYAYEISTGRLMAERMFHAEKKDPKSGNPILVSETRYTYDAQGNRSKPITYTFIKGKTAEEVFGNRNSTFPEKAFEDQKALANPNSKKVGEDQ